MDNPDKTKEPVVFEAWANRTWQQTNLFAAENNPLRIEFISGFWYFSPALPPCGPEGNSRYIAKPYYTLPGAPEGALIGRIGDKPFFIGRSAVTPQGLAGELELCINDDLEGRYGAGLLDNSGSLKISISVLER